MSRIRSVHPGLFTDEAFVSLSDAAQIFFIGLWTECDDQGAFEWKPVQLRLKLRGNRDGGVEGILAELEEANSIMSYEHNGRKFGLVRNFQRFQRPKKPNSTHFIPPQFRIYVGSSDASPEPDGGETPPSSPPVPHQLPTSGEKPPQMEDGGGRRKGKEEEGSERDARAPEVDPDHWKVVQGILETRNSEIDDWERDFLHSIKWKRTLTKAQRDSLASLQSKLAAKTGETRQLPSVTRGTPAYDAWIAHYRKRGSAAFYERQEALTVPTEFPPQEQAA